MHDSFLPLTLRELVVGLVFVVGIEVEDALDEVHAEHFWVLLQQQVNQTVFTQTGRGNRQHLGLILWLISPGSQRDWSKLCVSVCLCVSACARARVCVCV